MEKKTKSRLREILAKRMNVGVASVAVFSGKAGWDAAIMPQANNVQNALKEMVAELRPLYELTEAKEVKPEATAPMESVEAEFDRAIER